MHHQITDSLCDPFYVTNLHSNADRTTYRGDKFLLQLVVAQVRTSQKYFVKVQTDKHIQYLCDQTVAYFHRNMVIGLESV